MEVPLVMTDSAVAPIVDYLSNTGETAVVAGTLLSVGMGITPHHQRRQEGQRNH